MYNPDEECKAVIVRLKTICKIKGIKSNTLAKKARIANSTVSYILNGKTKPQIYMLFQLCNALEITIDELFDKTIINRENRTCNSCADKIRMNALSEIELSDDELALLTHYRYFSKKKKEMLQIYVDMLRQYKDNVE